MFKKRKGVLSTKNSEMIKITMVLISLAVIFSVSMGSVSAYQWNVNQGQSIQSVIDHNASENDTIIVNSGNYTENVVINKKNLKVKSNGNVIVSPTGIGPAFTINSLGNKSTLQGFKISGTAIYSGVSIDSASGCTLQDLTIEHCHGGGIYLSGTCNDITLQNIIINATDDNGIRSDGGSSINGLNIVNVNISDVTGSTGTVHPAIDLRSHVSLSNVLLNNVKVDNTYFGGIGISNSQGKLTITNCIITNNERFSTFPNCGLLLDNCSSVTLSNDIIDNNINGIYLKNISGTATNPVILDNFGKDNKGVVVTLENVNYITIQNNIFNQSKDYSTAIHMIGKNSNIVLENLTINNSTCRGASCYGTSIYKDPASSLENISISNVTINNPDEYGIYLVDQDGDYYLKNVSIDHVTVNNASNWAADIEMNSNVNSGNITIKNSNFNKWNGVKIYGKDNITLQNNIIINNNDWGLWLKGLNNPTVNFSNNTITGNIKGIYLEDVGKESSPIVLDNFGTGNSGNAVYLNNVSYVTVKNNTFNGSPVKIVDVTPGFYRDVNYTGEVVDLGNFTVNYHSGDRIFIDGNTYNYAVADVLDVTGPKGTLTINGAPAYWNIMTPVEITSILNEGDNNITISVRDVNGGQIGCHPLAIYNSPNSAFCLNTAVFITGTCNNITLQNLVITNSTSNGIIADDSSNIDGLSITNVTIYNPSSGDGIHLRNLSSNVILDHVEVDGASGNGISIYNTQGSLTIKNCTLTNNGQIYGNYWGVYYGLILDTCSNVTLLNNTIDYNPNGILLANINGSATNSVIIDNFGENNGGKFVTLENVNYITIKNNVFNPTKNYSTAVYITGTNSNITLDNLTIINPTDNSIIADGSSSVNGLNITNVTIYRPGAGDGIRLWDHSSLSNVVLDQVRVDSASGNGIAIRSTQGSLTVKNCNLTNNGQNYWNYCGVSYYGLYLDTCSNVTLLNNIIDNNTQGIRLSNINGSAINSVILDNFGSNGGIPVTLENVNYVIVRNNVFNSTKSYSNAVYITGTSSNITLDNLTIINPAGSGIATSGSSTVNGLNITNVAISNSTGSGIATGGSSTVNGLNIINVTISNSRGSGIAVGSSIVNALDIINVTISNSTGSGIAVGSSNINGWNITNVTINNPGSGIIADGSSSVNGLNITNVTIYRPGAGDGIRLWDHSSLSNVVLDQVRVDSACSNGIAIRNTQGSLTIKNCTLTNNFQNYPHYYGANYFGLNLETCSNVTLLNNIIDNNIQGIRLSNINGSATNPVILDNFGENNGGIPVDLENVNYVIVRNNVFNPTKSYSNAVYITGTSSNITLDNLTINNPTGNGVYCYYLSHLENITLQNMTINNSGGCGVNFADRNGDCYLKNILIDSLNVNNAKTAVHIEMQNVNSGNITIRNSSLLKSIGTGIEIPYAQGNIILDNNILKNNTGDGIYIGNSSANITINQNTIINNNNGIRLYNPAEVHLNRFVGNVKAINNGGSVAVNAINNWWGNSSNPSKQIYGAVNYGPWIVLNLNSLPSTIRPEGTSSVIADLTHNSNGEDISTQGYLPDNINLIFNCDSLGTINPVNTTINKGKAATTFIAGLNSGISTIQAVIDNETQNITVNILAETLGPIVNLNTGKIYISIEDAINDPGTLNGQVIIIETGTYVENIILNKKLNIQTLGNVTLQALNPSNPTIRINSDGSGSTIQGFYINGSSNSEIYIDTANGIKILNNVINGSLGDSKSVWGVCLVNSGQNNINNNTVTGCEEGINLYDSHQNTISSNTVKDNHWDNVALNLSTLNNITGNTVSNADSGIRLIGASNNNTIVNNDLTANIWTSISLVDSLYNQIAMNLLNSNQEGMYLYASDNNTILNNTANGNVWDGIAIHDSSSNIITGNTNVTGNNCGVRVIGTSSNNEIMNNDIDSNLWSDISLDTASANVIHDNVLSDAHVGLYLQASSNNQIYNNTIQNNSWDGIDVFYGSNSNTIENNTVSGSYYGERILSSTGNTNYQNNFVNNTVHAYDDSANSWDDGTTGNYWSDWNTTDPCLIDGGSSVDNYPSLTQF